MATNIEKARIRLIAGHPFFATVLLNFKWQLTTDVETAGVAYLTNTLYINPEWIGRYPVEETMGLLAHEVMHPAMLHNLRQGHRNAKGVTASGETVDLWNLACDYAIDPLIKDAGLALPGGGHINPEWADWPAEQ